METARLFHAHPDARAAALNGLPLATYWQRLLGYAVDLLIAVGPGKSLGFTMEAGRQLGYRQLRDLRNRLRAGIRAPHPKKVGLASPS